MTGVLDVAVYSDTTADESVDGVDGFNFRALSAGITVEDRRRIREELLHRVHPTWDHDHDELAHPPTCAYSRHGGRHYLARGHSTGLTLSGRSGNVVTQVVVTDDIVDFGGYRPAQLYAASAWTLAATPSGELEPWPVPSAVRPDFEAEALRVMLSHDPWAVRVLPRYLTMLEAAASDVPRRVVLIHRDLDVVMRWIAAGSLLLDDESTARLTFRALVDDPSRTDAAVVGLSPEFELEPVVGARVVDLERRTVSDVQPSDSSLARVAALLDGASAAERPAFALAARWEAAAGPELAARAASALHGAIPTADAWTLSLELLEALDDAGATDALLRPEPSIIDALADWSPSTPDEITAARDTRDRMRTIGATDIAAVLDRVSRDGLQRLVSRLAGDLDAHERAAELSVVNGSWDWLADEPDAAAVHPWLAAAAVGRLPREQRADALAHVRLRTRTWPIAIGRPILPRDNLLVAAWLRHEGLDVRLAAVVRNAVVALRNGQGSSDPSYDELLDAVLHAPYWGSDFPDEELAELAMDYAAVHERIEAARARVQDRANPALKPLLGDLADWGPAVAPHLGACLIDAVDARAVEYVAGEAGSWAGEGVRTALRSRFATDGKSDVLLRAVKVADSPHPSMATGALEFLTEDVKSTTLTRIRGEWERPERDRLDALLRSAGPERRRGRGGRFGKAKGA
ncbi:hypothetical protein SFC88_05735 [Nocardioides sp. HM23]|uniref:GAP1-N2 domain-containing protein n=1 Tax=Nocardioides bizhenqiangii TaxID=3095076 RepID=UPI002ACA988D|nr:hypothetical protein [Nocardioides sp. HM23]MDZ5620311.1 hypothetical protein [Nocardioides sp. HM23]